MLKCRIGSLFSRSARSRDVPLHHERERKDLGEERRGRGMSSPGEFQFSLRRAFSSSSFHFLPLARGTHRMVTPRLTLSSPGKSLPHRNPNLQIEFLSSLSLSRLQSTPLGEKMVNQAERPSLPPSLPSLSAPSVRPLSSL